MARLVYLSLVDADLTLAQPLLDTLGNPRTGFELSVPVARIPFHFPEAGALRQQLTEQIRSAVVLLSLIGETTHTSPWTDWEVETALRLGRGLVGVRLRPGIHDFIPRALRHSGAQVVDLHVPSIIASIDRAAFVSASRGRPMS